MKFIMLKYITFTTLLTVLLSACNGDGGPGGGGPIPTVESYPEDELIIGDFKQLSGSVYQGNVCPDVTLRDTYFQSENILVFGMPIVSEKELKMVATFAEIALSNVAQIFGISVEEFLAYRDHFNSNAYDYVMVAYGYQDEEAEEPTVGYQEWLAMSKEEKKLMLDQAAAYRNDDLLNYREDRDIRETPKQVIVCASYEGLGYSTGRGKPFGMQLRSPDMLGDGYKENDFAIYRHIIEHELVHYAQFIIPATTEHVLLPLWFAEGSAEYLTGGKIASSTRSLNRNVIESESEIYPEEYDEAALVIRYIAETLGNGKSSIFDLLLNIREKSTSDAYFQLTEFKEVFAETFVDYDGSRLEYDEIRNEYWSRLP